MTAFSQQAGRLKAAVHESGARDLESFLLLGRELQVLMDEQGRWSRDGRHQRRFVPGSSPGGTTARNPQGSQQQTLSHQSPPPFTKQ